MKREQGFTLIELLVSLAVITLLASLAVPSFKDQVQRSRSDKLIAELQQAFELARLTAIKERTMVTVCPSSDSVTCTPDWKLPVIVFNDPNNSRSIDNDEELLLQTMGLAYKGTLRMTPSRKPYFQWQPMGITHGTWGNIVYCSPDMSPRLTRKLTVSMAGRIRPSRDNDGDGKHDEAGRAISCV